MRFLATMAHVLGRESAAAAGAAGAAAGVADALVTCAWGTGAAAAAVTGAAGATVGAAAVTGPACVASLKSTLRAGDERAPEMASLAPGPQTGLVDSFTSSVDDADSFDATADATGTGKPDGAPAADDVGAAAPAAVAVAAATAGAEAALRCNCNAESGPSLTTGLDVLCKTRPR